MNVVDIFSGAGGLSYGLERAGFNTLLAVEKDASAVETFRYNIPSVCIQKDLTEYLPEDAPISKRNVNIIAGGPPCQDFSLANRYSRGGEKTNLVFVFAEWVKHFEPDVFIMENVPGITSTGTVFDDLCNIFQNEDYFINHKILNSKNFGVPQSRKRMILVGSKDYWIDLESPDAEEKNVSDAFEGLPSLKSGEVNENIPNHRAPDHQKKTVEKMEKAEYGEQLYDSWSERVKLNPNKQAPTLKAGQRINFHFAHPFDNRGLTVRERARLQSFPDDFIFKGSLTDQRTQTGNAVPVKMAEGIGEMIMSSIEEEKKPKTEQSVFDY